MAGDDTVTMQDKRNHRSLVQRFHRGHFPPPINVGYAL